MKKLIFFSLIFLLAISACGNMPSSSNGVPARAITTTTFLADITQNIAGERLTVESLLPVGMDPHAFQPSPADIARLAKSELLIVNGMGYETFLGPILGNRDAESQLVEASAGLESRNNSGDPHFWLDPILVIHYVENIRAGLTLLDPDGAQIYAANAKTYISQLKTLDAEIQQSVSLIPEEQRLLVTNHEALGYFADRYSFRIIGSVIPGLSTDASTSARQMAHMITLIKETKAPAIFLAELENPSLAEQIAAETGAKVVEGLYLETLTDGEGVAPTYIEMMLHNTQLIVEALKP